MTNDTPFSADNGRSALLVVDMQRDFCAGGALAVPEADRLLPAINRYANDARAAGLTIYASRDWHPAITNHFRAFGGQWPVHCVQGTAGAEFHPDLALPPDTIVVSKGQNPERPGYSAFDGETPIGQSFLADLRDRQIDHLYVVGVATDYCVKQSVLDARRADLAVTVLQKGIAGIDVESGDIERAIGEMKDAGATLA